MTLFLTGVLCALVLLIYTLWQRQSSQIHFLFALAALVLTWLGLLQILLDSQPNPLLSALNRLGIETNPYEVLLRELAAGSFDKVLKQVGGNPAMMSQLITWLAALILIAIGIIVWLSSRRSTQRNASSGVLLTGVGVILAVVPMTTRTAASWLQPATPQAVVQAATETPIPFATNTPMLITVAQDVALQPTHAEMVMTPLPTRFVYEAPTATTEAAATGTPQCSGTTQNNLNFREGPATAFNVIATIPHSTMINLYGKNADGSWLWVDYQGDSGWVSADYVIQSTDCPALPIHTN